MVVVGTIWQEYATALSGQPGPRRNRSRGATTCSTTALPWCPTPDGPVLAVYSADSRMHRERLPGGGPALGGVVRTMSGVNNDLFVAALRTPQGAVDSARRAAVGVAETTSAPAMNPTEAADVARVRAYRLEAGGKSYRLLRGEFHRHTEISPDGGGDGALEDMWRYAPRRRRTRLDRLRRPRQRQRPRVHLVDDPEDHRDVPRRAVVHSYVHL